MSPVILHGLLEADGKASRSEDGQQWARDVIARWELARQELVQLNSASGAERHALQVLIENDFPNLLNQLGRPSRD